MILLQQFWRLWLHSIKKKKNFFFLTMNTVIDCKQESEATQSLIFHFCYFPSQFQLFSTKSIF